VLKILLIGVTFVIKKNISTLAMKVAVDLKLVDKFSQTMFTWDISR
jgi:hypothetical protein